MKYEVLRLFQDLEMIFHDFSHIQNDLLQFMVQFACEIYNRISLRTFATGNFKCLPYDPLSQGDRFIDDIIAMKFQELAVFLESNMCIRRYMHANILHFIKTKETELFQVYKNNICFLLIYGPTYIDTHLLS